MKMKSKTNNKVITRTKNKQHKTHKKTMCAPFIEPINLSKSNKLSKSNINIISSATDESCFSIDALRKIAEKWNSTHPNMKIQFNLNTSGKTLWHSINNAMSSKCNNEVCWLKQDFIKNTPLSCFLYIFLINKI